MADLDTKDTKMSDFLFLSVVGSTRNWRSECAICLTDEIMGTVCQCGHTETVMLPPTPGLKGTSSVR